MEANGRLVEHVKHPAEVGTELRRETDALRLASGQGRDTASELQITEPDLAQEPQPFANLRQDVARDLRGTIIEPEPMKKLKGLLHRSAGESVNGGTGILPVFRLVSRTPHERRGQAGCLSCVEPHGARDRIQSHSFALRTKLAFTFLPTPPTLFNRIGARAAVHVLRQIKQLAEPTAFLTPALRRVVAEIFRVERLEGTAAFRTGALG